MASYGDTTTGAASSTVQIRDGFHRAAIALNNTAVSLLLRGFGVEACETMADALMLMECATTASNVSLHNDSAGQFNQNVVVDVSSSSSEPIQGALGRACRRTSLCGGRNTNPAANGTSGGSGSASTAAPLPAMAAATTGPHANDWPTLHVVSTQDNPTHIYDHLTACSDSASLHVAFPMTIDLEGATQACTVNDVYYEAAVMVYNHGICHYCLSHHSQSPNRSHIGPSSMNAATATATLTNIPATTGSSATATPQSPPLLPSLSSARTTTRSATVTNTDATLPCVAGRHHPHTINGSANSSAAAAATTTTVVANSATLNWESAMAAPHLAHKAFAVFQWVMGTLAHIRLDDEHDYDAEGNPLDRMSMDDDTVARFTLSCQLVLLRLVLNHTLLNLSISLRWDDAYYMYSHAMHDLLRTIEVHQYYYCPIPDADATTAAAAAA